MFSGMTIPSFLRDLSRVLRRRRRLLAGLAAAAAVYLGLTSLAPAPPPTVPVLAADRDLPGGVVPDALRTIRLPVDAVPSGALTPGADLSKRVLSGPIRAGEPLTDVRFLGPPLVPAGLVAYPFRIDDSDIGALLRVGDRLDLYTGTSTATDSAGLAASSVRVIALPKSMSTGALIVVGVPRSIAARLAQATTNSRISVALTPDTS